MFVESTTKATTSAPPRETVGDAYRTFRRFLTAARIYHRAGARNVARAYLRRAREARDRSIAIASRGMVA